MALIKNNKTGLYLIAANAGSGDWGNKQQAIKNRYRFSVEVACAYSQKLRAAGHDVKAVTDNGQDAEPQQALAI